MKKFVKPLITVLLVAALLVPTVAMLYSSAASSYTVELAFENLFVFDHWASNQNSTRITSDAGGGEKDGTLTNINIANGSFRLTDTSSANTGNIYTTASMGTGEAAKENGAFYSMPVEEGATYTFSYNVTGSVGAFYPYVFFYDEANEFYIDLLKMEPATGYGENSYSFIVPENMTHIQLRFTIPNAEGSAYADVSNIAIYKVDMVPDETNLFDFSTWSTKTGSGGGDSVYAAGTRKINDDESVTLTSNGSDNLGGCSSFLTGFALGAYDNTHFTIDTQPGKTYYLSYELVDTTLDSVANATVLIPWYNSSNSWTGSYGDYAANKKGTNTHTFTVPADVYHFQVVVGIYDWSMTNGKYATVKNIEIREVVNVPHKVDPTRKSYTYSGDGKTYGTLPTPNAATIPEGYVFAGWYTGKDGTGIRIAADTPIQPMSYTVYPKFEPVADSLTVATPPAKTEYTVGEKLNTTGLVLKATVGGQTIDIPSGYYCTPGYLTSIGTQTITAHYGGKTATFTVNVSAGNDKNIVANGAAHAVTVANNEYTINFHPDAPFNRYEMTYFSDSYVKGIITMDGVTEEFFLEPSDNGSFASYIDSFLRGVNHFNVDSIKFTCLDKEFGNFELLSLTTIAAPVPSDPMQYYENDEYKVGINLDFGGVVSYIEDLKDTGKGKVTARVYNENGKAITKVDYANNLASGHLQESTSVNLINIHDKGRYLQQSYYGTASKPFEMGDYNGVPWNYNPVQGGNLESTVTGNGGEASKIIDYRITDDQIYIKTRPLDWGKNSVDYPDSYNTPSYMEAWYVFEDGMIKTYCRFVDYSGYPSNTTTQEFPALYTVEPLNHFVYNNVSTAWSGTNYEKIEEPEFWGVLPEYNALLQQNGKPAVNPDRVAVENWAAFMASDDADSFGIGVYSPGIEDMHFGTYPAIYNEEQVKNGRLEENYRHAQTTNPAAEPYTSYISPVGIMTFESYKPVEYSFYITTGTASEIHNDFKTVANKDNQAELDKAKIAVPETVYMTPANGASKVGQYYVNNIMDESNNNNIITEAVRDAGMYLGLSIKDAKEFSVKITNVTDPSNDIFLCNTSGSEISETSIIKTDGSGTYKNNTAYGLRFSGAGLQPGEKATAKWEITVYKNDGSSETFTAYTVMYAPGRTVGAVAEARQVNASQNEISSWITGANGVDHSKRAPLGSFHGDYHDSGYFRVDPLVNPNTPPTGGSGESEDDYIIVDGINGPGTSIDYSENSYVLQTATNGHDGSRAQSYLGLLTVDKSRYSNTDQIPNLKIGFDALRVGDSYPKNSLENYTTYYTLGTESSFVSQNIDDTPSGWTVHSDYNQLVEVIGENSIPFRETLIPSYKVSDIDGKYIHAIAWGEAYQTLVARRHATAGTSVLCSVTDKSGLRDAVLNGYAQAEDDPDFIKVLENAATVLGDPSATQPEIDEAKKDLNKALEDLIEKFYALKYDNLFSAYEFSQHPDNMKTNVANATVKYENATITVNSNGTEKNDVYTTYHWRDDSYLVKVKPNTAYVYEFDVKSDKGAQAFLFFYGSNGSGVKVTDRSVQVNSGNQGANTEDVPHFGVYPAAGTNHYVIRFTTGSDIDTIGFRFGNNNATTVESTFSNIRLVEADKYYADVEYAKTEDVYKEYTSYGVLPTLTRTGYTFSGWVDAAGKTVTGADIATDHKSIFSVWTENKYTIVYNANGGSGSIVNQTATYTQNVALASGGYTKSGYKLLGWSTDPNATTAQYTLGQTVSKLTDVKNGTVTLYAVWASSEVNVTFDNLIDMKAWQSSDAFKGNSSISETTNTGFSVTNEANGHEKTAQSTFFSVEPGKQYKIDIDITGDNWDVYIFFCNENGAWVDFSDSTNRYSYGGGGNASQIFTAPNKSEVVKAQIRVDSNTKTTAHTVKFENIRVYEYDGISPIEVNTSNKYVNSGDKNTFGTLPTPSKEGFTFQGWYDENGNQVSPGSFVPEDTDGLIPLTSKWRLADTALSNDLAVIDFSSPIAIDAKSNDTILNKAAAAYNATASIIDISVDGNTYASTADGTYGTFTLKDGKIVYTPTSAVNGVENIYYRAQLSGDTTVVKSKITVAPASNVLYEENVFTATGTELKWKAPDDAEAGTANQDASPVEKEVYGYDSNVNGYNKLAKYSNGSALAVTVDATNKRSQNLSFDFAGEGFDLIGACGADTGVLVVTLRDNNYVNEKGETVKKMVKSYIVDTYYSDLDEDGNGRYADTLYQVPLISENGLKHSNYTIQIIASYLPSMSGALNTQAVGDMTVSTASSYADNELLREALADVGLEYVLDAETVDVVWFDEDSVLNGGEGVNTVEEGMIQTQAVTSLLNVVDSVRVYNPLEDGNSYYIESERNAEYYNVIDNLVNIDEENGNVITGSGNFAYISGKDNETISFDAYSEVGPKDELYLAKDTGAVAFSIKGFDNTTRIMISLRAASGTPKVEIGGYAFEVKSNTEMYYDITDYIKNGIVTIENTADKTLLSVGSVKITNKFNAFVLLSTDFDLATASAMMMAPSITVEPNTPVVPEVPTEPEDTTDPANPGDTTDTTKPGNTTKPTKPENTYEFGIVKLFKWIISVLEKIFPSIGNLLGL